MINDQLAKWVSRLKNAEYSPAEDLPSSRKSVLMMLLAYACWTRRKCYPGIPRLANDTGYSERTVQGALRDLERWGYVEMIRAGCRGDGHGRGRLANEYRVNVPDELLPAKYRTNRQSLPESQDGLTGNQRGLTGNEQRDQPATIATQDNHKKISIKQDNGRLAPEAADAVFSSEEKRIRAEAIKLGVKPELVETTLLLDGLERAAEVLANLKRWDKRNDRNASKAWESILRSEPAEKTHGTNLPFDPNLLDRYARDHGLPLAKPGEELQPYRQRLLEYIANAKR